MVRDLQWSAFPAENLHTVDPVGPGAFLAVGAVSQLQGKWEWFISLVACGSIYFQNEFVGRSNKNHDFSIPFPSWRVRSIVFDCKSAKKDPGPINARPQYWIWCQTILTFLYISNVTISSSSRLLNRKSQPSSSSLTAQHPLRIRFLMLLPSRSTFTIASKSAPRLVLWPPTMLSLLVIAPS